MSFKSLLQEFDNTLKTYNPVEYEKLQSPLTEKEIDSHLKELGINDDNIRTLYNWKNGETPDSYCEMTFFGGLQSLELIKEFRTFERPYDAAFIELISDNGEDTLLFNTTPGEHYGKLYLYSIGLLYIDHPISYFDSLESMVRTMIESYKNGIFKYDNEKLWLDVDYLRYFDVCKRLNKNSAYWNEHNKLKWEDWYAI